MKNKAKQNKHGKGSIQIVNETTCYDSEEPCERILDMNLCVRI